MKAYGMKLQFPAAAENPGDAFNNAIDAGVMERDSGSHKFWARFAYLASDIEGDKVIADYFFSPLSNVYTRVPREEGSA